MGYRSSVAIAMTVRTEDADKLHNYLQCAELYLQGLSDTVAGALVPKRYASLEQSYSAEGVCHTLILEWDDVKWYPDYADVKATHHICTGAKVDWPNAAQDFLLAYCDANDMPLAWHYTRVGEGSNDVEEDSGYVEMADDELLEIAEELQQTWPIRTVTSIITDAETVEKPY